MIKNISLWLDFVATHPSIPLIYKPFPIESYKMKKKAVFPFLARFLKQIASLCLCLYWQGKNYAGFFNFIFVSFLQSFCLQSDQWRKASLRMLTCVQSCSGSAINRVWNQIYLGCNLGCSINYDIVPHISEPQFPRLQKRDTN